MPVACQIIKPLCLVVGMMERHTGLGLTPVGVPAPNNNTFWMSMGPIYNGPLGDPKSTTVFSQGSSSFLKRGQDSKRMRPHISLFSAGPPVVPPGSDLGLITLVIAFGSTKALWGPYSVKAEVEGAQNPAVKLVPPGSFAGLANFIVCSDLPIPIPCPNLVNIQVPNTVFAGMSPGDIIGNLVTAEFEAVISFVVSKIMKSDPIESRTSKVIEKVTDKAVDYVRVKLAGALRRRLLDKTFTFLTKEYVEEETKHVRNKVTNAIEKKVEKVVKRPLTEILSKKIDTTVDWGLSKAGGEEVIDRAGDASNESIEEHFGEGEGGEEAGGPTEGGEGNGAGNPP